jgi:hypothetical protein
MPKTWQKPILIVLLRGKPEEAVLISCKTALSAPSSPNNIGGACFCPSGASGDLVCISCQCITAS